MLSLGLGSATLAGCFLTTFAGIWQLLDCGRISQGATRVRAGATSQWKIGE
jgi:hypothetical protein